MSALDKALRQLEQQREIREHAACGQRLMSDFSVLVAPVRPPQSRWMWAAVVVLSLALAASWLIMAVGWPASISMSDWHFMGKPHASAARLAGPESSGGSPALPLSVAPTTAQPPVSTLGSKDAFAVAAEVVAPSPKALTVPATLSTAEPGKSSYSETGAKFTYPAWHKGANRMWSWGLWEEASKLWLKGLKSEDPNVQLRLIADRLSQLAVTRMYAAWSPLLPVVALPKSGVTKKKWLLLAVPAAHDLARAQQLLQMTQGQVAMVNSWSHWQTFLHLTDGADAAVSQSSPSQAVAAPVTSAALVTSPGSVRMPSSSAATRVRNLPTHDPRAELSDTAQSRVEPAQLSRTEADRLPASGPTSPTAKAIDDDYQMIEKSLARGEHQAALDAAIKLEKYIGENWRTQYLVGVALMGMSRWEQAIVALGKAQERNPKHANAALYLSVALQERGEHARAIQVLDKAQQMQPLSPELWLNQGHSHQALGHKAEARNAYNRFLELSVNRQDLAVQRVWVQNRLQKDNG